MRHEEKVMGFMGNHGKGIINSSSFIDREFDLAKPADWADWLTGKKQADKLTSRQGRIRCSIDRVEIE